MDFRVLGPIEVDAAGQPLVLRGERQRTLLAALLVQVNEVVATDRLIEALWDERPPETARAALQVHVSQLRKLLGSDRVVTSPRGYLLRVEAGELDLERFERLVAEAAGATGSASAAKLREALAIWRGHPFAGFEHHAFARPEISRLEELRLDVEEQRIDEELALGLHAHVLPELEAGVRKHPYRERRRGQLMLALYRSGRQAEALDAYRSGRESLVEALGIEPGPGLRRLERAILDQLPELEVPLLEPVAIAPGKQAKRPRGRATSFVGRNGELREIRALLGSGGARLLTLTGVGGVGKTRLAAEATTDLVDEYPDGVSVVELAPISDPDLVAGAIADALGLGETSGNRPVEALVSHLRGKRALIVLDNFEQVLPANALLADLMADAPGVTLLVTSRAPLDIHEERVYPVPALQLPDHSSPRQLGRLRRTEAVRLFVDRARAARPEFTLTEANADAVAELCLRLDGLPLALELAAARIKLLSPGEILERLEARLEALKAEPGAGVPERHRTLSAAIAWSYDLLAPAEQSLFASLSVFVGGFTLEGARVVAGDLEVDVVAEVESLLTNSLLRTEPIAGGEPRFRMLETIREHALERLAEGGDGDAVRRRHAHFYLQLAEAAEDALLGPHQLGWLYRLDAERDNLRAALLWASGEGEPDVGLLIGAALWRFWQLRGADTEGREHLERLLGRGRSETARALAQARLTSLALVHGDHQAVLRYGEACLPVLRETGDARVAGVLGVMATACLALGEVDRARALAEDGLEAARRAGGSVWTRFARFNLGVVLAWQGELDAAERLVEASVADARKAGDARSVANWLRALGGIVLAHGDYTRARDLFEESLAIHRTLDDAWGTSHTLSRLGLVMLEIDDHDASRRLIAESVAIERETGDRPGLTFNLEVLAALAMAEGHPTRAARLYACSSTIRETVGSHPTEVGWPDYAGSVAHLRATLSEQAFAEAWEEGRTMTPEDSFAYALDNEAESEQP